MKKALTALLVNVANLFKIKSIITLLIIFTISYLVVVGIDVPSEYAAFAGSIITYFFTKDTKKDLEVD